MKQYTYRYLTGMTLVFVLAGGLIQAQGGEGSASSEEIKKRDKAEQNIAPFDSEYYQKFKTLHLAVLFDIVDGKLVVSDKPVAIGAGQGPHRPASGNFVVVSKTKEGKTVDRYLMEDPTVARSFEGTSKHLTRITKAKDIAIIIPMNPGIASIEMGAVKKERISFDVEKKIVEAAAQMKRLIDRRN